MTRLRYCFPVHEGHLAPRKEDIAITKKRLLCFQSIDVYFVIMAPGPKVVYINQRTNSKCSTS